MNENTFPPQLIPVGENGKIEIRKAILDTIVNGDAETVAEKTIVMRSKYTTGRNRDVGLVSAPWLPKELTPFCENPESTELPRTVDAVMLVRPMDMEKLANGDPTGEALIGFVSSLPQSYGPNKERAYLTGYELVDEEDVFSMETPKDDVGQLLSQLNLNR